MTAPGILWLTRDFRLHDNPALQAAIADGPLLPVFIIDRLTMTQGAASRWRLMRPMSPVGSVMPTTLGSCERRAVVASAARPAASGV